MYIGMTKWTNQDGTERRTESYVCSYATKHRGTSVCRRNGVVASQVEDEVMEYTRKIVRNPQFIKDFYSCQKNSLVVQISMDATSARF